MPTKTRSFQPLSLIPPAGRHSPPIHSCSDFTTDILLNPLSSNPDTLRHKTKVSIPIFHDEQHSVLQTSAMVSGLSGALSLVFMAWMRPPHGVVRPGVEAGADRRGRWRQDDVNPVPLTQPSHISSPAARVMDSRLSMKSFRLDFNSLKHQIG